MTDSFTIVHAITTGAIALGMLYFAARNFFSDKEDKKRQVIEDMQKEIQDLNTKCAVISERLDNQIDSLDDLQDKLDDIYKLLLEE